jgi:hypothetical protein
MSPQDERDARIALLRVRLRDAQALMGCGDAPDIAGAAGECERIEAELAALAAPSAGPQRRLDDGLHDGTRLG